MCLYCLLYGISNSEVITVCSLEYTKLSYSTNKFCYKIYTCCNNIFHMIEIQIFITPKQSLDTVYENTGKQLKVTDDICFQSGSKLKTIQVKKF